MPNSFGDDPARWAAAAHGVRRRGHGPLLGAALAEWASSTEPDAWAQVVLGCPWLDPSQLHAALAVAAAHPALEPAVVMTHLAGAPLGGENAVLVYLGGLADTGGGAARRRRALSAPATAQRWPLLWAVLTVGPAPGERMTDEQLWSAAAPPTDLSVAVALVAGGWHRTWTDLLDVVDELVPAPR